MIRRLHQKSARDPLILVADGYFGATLRRRNYPRDVEDDQVEATIANRIKKVSAGGGFHHISGLDEAGHVQLCGGDCFGQYIGGDNLSVAISKNSRRQQG